MKNQFKNLAVALVSLCFAGVAAAHHSAAEFDFRAKQVSYKGVVKEFAAINPHMRLLIEVKDAKGTHTIKFEGHSTNNMYRAGYRKGMVSVGDVVTVNAAPRRDGSEGGYVTFVELADGRSFGVHSGAQAQDQARDAARVKAEAEGR